MIILTDKVCFRHFIMTRMEYFFQSELFSLGQWKRYYRGEILFFLRLVGDHKTLLEGENYFPSFRFDVKYMRHVPNTIRPNTRLSWSCQSCLTADPCHHRMVGPGVCWQKWFIKELLEFSRWCSALLGGERVEEK